MTALLGETAPELLHPNILSMNRGRCVALNLRRAARRALFHSRISRMETCDSVSPCVGWANERTGNYSAARESRGGRGESKEGELLKIIVAWWLL
jgi:hypothetical protein